MLKVNSMVLAPLHIGDTSGKLTTVMVKAVLLELQTIEGEQMAGVLLDRDDCESYGVYPDDCFTWRTPSKLRAA